MYMLSYLLTQNNYKVLKVEKEQIEQKKIECSFNALNKNNLKIAN